MNSQSPDVFFAFKFSEMWSYFKSQHFSFWMICAYLFFEFVKPQALFPIIDVIPWAQCILILALIGYILDPTKKWTKSTANTLIILFFITIIISIITATYPEISKEYFINFFGWFVIYFLTINIVNTPKRFYIFLTIYLLAAGKIAFGTSKAWAFRGFSFASWGLSGPSGYFQNSGELAILMVMLFPLSYNLFQHLKNDIKTWEKLLLIIFWVCPILTVLGASSRGAQVALMAQIIIMFRKSLFKLKPLIGVTLLIISLATLLPDEQKERFSSAGDDRTSQQRLLYWKNGWQMMQDYPLTGVGYFNFAPYFQSHYSHDMLYKQAQLPHNIFIQVGTDAGFIALALFIFMIIYALIRPMQYASNPQADPFAKAVASGLSYGVLGYVIAGQFVTVTYYPFFWVHLALIVSLLHIYTPKNLRGR